MTNYITNQEEHSKSRVHFWQSIVGGMLGTLFILALFLYFTGAVSQSFVENQPVMTPVLAKQNQEASKALNDFESAILGAVETTKGAVVSIGNLQEPLGQMMGMEQGLSQDSGLQVAGEGSGVIYKIEGDKAYIITNNHVIDGNKALEIILSDGQKVEAELVGADQVSDLAVLTMDAKYATNIIKFADSDEIKVGSLAIAIGSPLGSEFASSVTQGIISGVNRTMPVDADGDGQDDWEATLLQTDAAINPGNSGGALVNKSGQLIGINSSKFSSTEIEGMGFAIPSNEVKNIVEQLESKGKVTRPFLGISTVDVAVLSDTDRLETLKLPEDQVTGVAVRHVQEDSAASKAGIQVYDVITQIDDQKIEGVAELRNNLYRHKAGDKLTIKYLHEGKEKTAEVILQTPKN